ncbi:MAG: squalene/phytoene synthase family protein [Planctomycetota bacterium]|nr:squalene/phytoene synthase family protein [Planctomycetota bacterium]
MAKAGAGSLEASYARCIEVTRERAKNFHFAFQVLPEERYRGICALYAFARLADDYSDEETDPERALANARRWREDFDRALAGDPGGDEVLPAVADTVRRYKIAPIYFHELIAGTEMDATIKRYATWPETYRYCYRVASVIGIMTIHVFGFRDETGRALKLAEETGIAFQMTNILRDIKEDAGRDRIYLPQDDLARHGVGEADLLAAKDTPAFRALVKFEAERTKDYYRAAEELTPMIEGAGRPALEALVKIYRRLLEEIERRDYDVLSKRVSLSKAEKLRLAGGVALKSLLKS